MAMTVVCPNCSRKLNVPEDLIGELVKCPVCSQNFKVDAEVAAASAAPEPSPVQPQPIISPEAPRTQHSKSEEDAPAWEFAPTRRRDLEPHRGTIVLVLGILSIVIPCANLILGPIAWSLGSTDLRSMRAGRMDPAGQGVTQAGYVCGIIGTVLAVIHCCGFGSCMTGMWH